MAKYKPGDRVRVRKDLEENEIYTMEDESEYNSFTSGMKHFEGREVTINKISDGQYLIKEYGNYWVDGMFEDIKDVKEENEI